MTRQIVLVLGPAAGARAEMAALIENAGIDVSGAQPALAGIGAALPSPDRDADPGGQAEDALADALARMPANTFLVWQDASAGHHLALWRAAAARVDGSIHVVIVHDAPPAGDALAQRWLAFHGEALARAGSDATIIAAGNRDAVRRFVLDAAHAEGDATRVARLEARVAELERTRHALTRQLDGLSGARAEARAEAGARRLHGRAPERWAEGAEGPEPDWPDLSEWLGRGAPARGAARICVVADLPRAAGAGRGAVAACRELADGLARAGHAVTVLDVGAFTASTHAGERPAGVMFDAAVGLVSLPAPEVPSARGPVSRVMARPRAVHEWLRAQEPFDVVVGSDAGGELYYALLAKHLGLGYAHALFCVRPAAPTLWRVLANNNLLTDRDDLIRIHAERKCLSLADVVISPSRYMLRWWGEQGCALRPGRCFVLPGPVPSPDPPAAGVAPLRHPVDEVVYFGALDTGQGIKTFCKAIARLDGGSIPLPRVTFLGPAVDTLDHQGYLREQFDGGKVEWRVITDLDTPGALDYLGQPGRVAVIPPSMANAARAVVECLFRGVPFIASDAGGVPELVAPQDHADALFDPKPPVLAAHVADLLERGAVIPRQSAAAANAGDGWRALAASLGDPSSKVRALARRQSAADRERQPKVSVCIAHFNRPRELSQALDSLHHQTYSNFEVVIVDDGSQSPEALAFLDRLEPDFAARGWRIVRQQNRYLGAVRNTGARHATGEYLMFMDDDNCAKPHEIETFVRAAEYSGADVLTCFADHFRGADAPSGRPLVCVTPLGDAASSGLFANTYGDSNCLVRRSSFEALGGFTEEFGIGNDDQEFFSRVVLSGYRLMVVPEALYWYRISETRMRSLHLDVHSGKLRVFRPYLDAAPPALADALRLTQGAWIQYEAVRRELDALNEVVENVRRDQEVLARVRDGGG